LPCACALLSGLFHCTFGLLTSTHQRVTDAHIANKLCRRSSFRSFLLNRETAVSYLNSLHHVFIFDGYANWDPEARIKVRPSPPCSHLSAGHRLLLSLYTPLLPFAQMQIKLSLMLSAAGLLPVTIIVNCAQQHLMTTSLWGFG
jgi:hypothetical protein